MEEELLIGVDIGTQGTKACVYRPDGTMEAQAFEDSRLIYGRDGSVTQDPEEIYQSVLRTIRKAVEMLPGKENRIRALSIDGQMAGVMGVDEEWNAVTPYDSWLDNRCEPYIEKMKQEAEQLIIEKTGGQVTYAHGPKILWWKYEKKDVYNRIDKFIQPSVYVVGKMCGFKGEQAYMDGTYLHFSGFGDNKNLKWCKKLLDQFQVDERQLPRICRSDEKAGQLTREAAKACGLEEGVLVAAGCGDSAASALGCGITGPGQLYDVAGTASIFAAAADTYSPDTEEKTILYARSAVDHLWMPMAYLSGGGLCIRWFQEMMGMEYSRLEKLAAQVPWGSEGLFFIPHFAGVTCPNMPHVRGGYMGLMWNHTKGHMYRSILESIVWEYGNYLRILKEKLGLKELTGIYGVGGGTKSRLFNQMKAEVLGLPYYTLEIEESAAWGSAVIAGMAAGIFDSWEAAKRPRKIKEVFYPQMKESGYFQPFVLRYSKLLSCMNNLDGF